MPLNGIVRGSMSMFVGSFFQEIHRFFRPVDFYAPVLPVWEKIVHQSRHPSFYKSAGVPDSLDGRYEMVCLHAFLVMHRLVGQGQDAQKFSQKLFDYMIEDFDGSLREMGISDLKIGDRVKEMTRGFYGRAVAYRDGLKAETDVQLCQALDCNMFGTEETPTVENVRKVARYIRSQNDHLCLISSEKVLEGDFEFLSPEF